MDEELRALERTFRGSGTREAELAWLRARARSGDAAADVDRLSPALRSGSDAKASQALKVLSEAGELPHALLPEVFCITQVTSLKKARKAAKKLFEVHAPQPLQAAVKAHLKRSLFGAGETKVADRLRAIETEGGDGLDFARLAELLCEDHNTGFLYVLRHGAEKDVERAIRGRIEDASLDLVNLELERLPDLSAFPELEAIEAGSNRLKEFPLELAALPKLRSLDLGGNFLHALPADLSQFSALRELFLGVNRFRVFPEGVLTLSKLERLDLSTEDFNPVRVEKIPPGIERLPELRELRVGRNEVEIPDEIGALKRLETFGVWLPEGPAGERIRALLPGCSFERP